MKVVSKVFGLLAILLSDVMCAVVAYKFLILSALSYVSFCFSFSERKPQYLKLWIEPKTQAAVLNNQDRRIMFSKRIFA